LGAACGLIFVYASDLPEIRALETYRPNVVTEIYADDGQMVGSFALQRRILMTGSAGALRICESERQERAGRSHRMSDEL
jgi:membrane carboxypeptidase/penicillin-binding protein